MMIQCPPPWISLSRDLHQIRRSACLFKVLVILLLGMAGIPMLRAQNPESIRVGLAGEEPFVIPGPTPAGLAVDLWEKLAAANGWAFEYSTFPSPEEAIQSVKNGHVDVLIGDLEITKDRLALVEFSQPFFRSGLQIMVTEARPHTAGRLGDDLAEIFRLRIFWFVGAAVLVLTVAVFFFERKHNPDFPKPRREGLAEAFYYVITLALTGKSSYKGFGGVLGRLVMVAWILLGVLMVAYVTSSITSTMTIEKMEHHISGPKDLPGKTVGAIADSAGAKYLQNKGVTCLPAPNLATAVQDMLDRKSAAIVGDAPVLQSYDFSNPRLPITEVGAVFSPLNYGFALPIGSPLRLPLNRALLELEESGDVAELYRTYFGSSWNP
jgi:ABC-type amino acid transport substrate-binding protein